MRQFGLHPKNSGNSLNGSNLVRYFKMVALAAVCEEDGGLGRTEEDLRLVAGRPVNS